MMLLASLHGLAQAEADKPPVGFSGEAGLGAANTATYEGSPHRRTLATPDITLHYQSQHWGSADVGQRGLSWQPLELGNWSLALLVGIDFGRKTKDVSSFDLTPGDSRLAGMGDIDKSLELGASIGYGPASVTVRKGVGDRGHRGTLVDMNLQMPVQLSEKAALHFGASATWADAHYLQTYFGVTAAQAQASGFAPYTPKAGCREVGLNAGGEYRFLPNWKVHANLDWTRLAGDAKSSPLVAKRSSPTVFAGVVYVF